LITSLNYSRLERSPVVPKPVEFNLLQAIEHSFINSRREVSNIDYRMSVLPGTDPIPEDLIVNADKMMLEQVLDNLLGNAFKYTERGKIVLNYGLVHEQTVFGERTLHVEVADTGVGIDPKLHQHIFEPFVQENNSYTRDFEGAGLGLAICKKLIDLMRGVISVKSNSWGGTTFYFEIPMEVSSPGSAEDELVMRTTINRLFSKPLKVLCVEDNPQNMDFITAIIKSLGGEPYGAKNGLEALELCRRNSYHRILMDLSMPKLDGFETTQRIRSVSGPNKNVPIIALTANLNNGTRTRCMQSGFNEFLTKPVTPEKVLETLESETL
jgi:CheY-like chemotaxis protein